MGVIPAYRQAGLPVGGANNAPPKRASLAKGGNLSK